MVTNLYPRLLTSCKEDSIIVKCIHKKINSKPELVRNSFIYKLTLNTRHTGRFHDIMS